ncbi:MAG: hypothetical protein NTW01_14560 [Gammaproteobacteria bacterium]|nr:hypothetical protein [Gammaproteobacteria bacterium]
MEKRKLIAVFTAVTSFLLAACNSGGVPSNDAMVSASLMVSKEEKRHDSPWNLYYGNLRNQEKKTKLTNQESKGVQNSIKEVMRRFDGQLIKSGNTTQIVASSSGLEQYPNCSEPTASGGDSFCYYFPGDTIKRKYSADCSSSESTVSFDVGSVVLPDGASLSVSPNPLVLPANCGAAGKETEFSVTIDTRVTTNDGSFEVRIPYTQTTFGQPDVIGTVNADFSLSWANPVCCHNEDGLVAGTTFPGDGSLFFSFQDYQDSDNPSAVRRYSSSQGWAVGPPMPFMKSRTTLQMAGDPSYAQRIQIMYPGGEGQDFWSLDSGSSWNSSINSSDVLSHMPNAGSNETAWMLLSADGSVTTWDRDWATLTYTPRGRPTYRFSGTFDEGSSTTGIMRMYDDAGRSISYLFDLEVPGFIAGFVTQSGLEYRYQFDSNYNLERVTYPDGGVKQYSYVNKPASKFNTAGQSTYWQLASETDESGQLYRSWSYDDRGRVTAQSYAGGIGSYLLDYVDDQHVVVTDPLGTVRNFTYQTQAPNQPVLVSTSMPCESCGNSASKILDTRGRVVETADFLGRVTRHAYDGDSTLRAKTTEAVGTLVERTTEIEWDARSRLPTKIKQSGRTTQNVYDDGGKLLQKSIKDAASSRVMKTAYTYTSSNGISSVDGPRTDVADTTTISYYPVTEGDSRSGRIHQVTNALGHVTTYDLYDADGHALRMTDPNGVVSIFAYTARGKVASIQVASEIRTFDYWPTGLLKKISLPSGQSYTYSYNAAHHLIGVVDPDGNRIEYQVDGMGNRTATRVYDPAGTLVQIRQRTYDSLNRLWKEIGAYSEEITVHSYDGNGNHTGSTDPLGRLSSAQYDALGRASKLVDTNQGVTSLALNALDQVVSVEDPRGLDTSYTVNGFGNVEVLSSPDSGSSASTFDEAGNLKSRIDAKGQTTTYAYDALNRVTLKTRSDGSAVIYTWDQHDMAHGYGIGRLTGVSDSAGIASDFKYDAHGRLIRKSVTVGSQTLTTSWSYNATTGLLASMTTPSGRSVLYTWTRGRITALAGSNGSTTLAVVSNIQYQPFGDARSWRFANGQTINRVFDLDGRIVSDAVETVSYDAASRITGWSLGGFSQLNDTHAFSYDALDRVIGFGSSAIGSRSFTYDASGNRLSQAIEGEMRAYTMDPNNNRYQRNDGGVPAGPYTYDTNGSRTGHAGRMYSYDAERRLSGFNYGTRTATYSYDDASQRVRKIVNGVVTLFAYDDGGRLIGEYNASGVATLETIYLGNIPLVLFKGNTAYYVHSDHRNTPRQIDNASRQAVWRWNPTPFGDSAADGNPSSLSSTFTYNPRYPGQYYDAESGLHHNWHRSYDPALGRYLESDPLGLEAGINTYAYVGGNPVSRIDPMGLYTEIIIWQPVGYSSSSFGHVSANINGTNYSWGPGGWDGKYPNASDYAARQQGFRSGTGALLNLTADQENRLEACYAQRGGEYSAMTNNCGDPHQDCLQKVLGAPLSNSFFPVNIGNDLLNSPYFSGSTFYPGPERGFWDDGFWAR